MNHSNSTSCSVNGPLVSVIVPHFNRSHLLRETLESIYRQTCVQWEVIIVDDGSSDREKSSLREMANSKTRVYFRMDGHKGPSRCRNLGAHHAQGEYLLFLDSDDLLAPWSIESRLKLMTSSPNLDAVIFPVALFRKVPGDLADYWNDLKGEDDIERFIISDPVWQTSSPLWRKVAFLSTGGFDERVMYGDDGELHLRALLTKKVLRKHPDEIPDVFIRRGDQDRITARADDELLRSRRIRLEVGSEVIRRLGDDRQRSLWQSQYVDECEFLLFNVESGEPNCLVVLDDWAKRWPEFRRGRSIFRKYIQIGWRTRNRYRILLRIARRIAMQCCPRVFFPPRRPRETTMPEATISLIRKNFATEETHGSFN